MIHMSQDLIAAFIGLMINIIFLGYFAGAMNSRLKNVEKRIESIESSNISAELARLSEALSNIKDQITDLKACIAASKE
mgnify:FL=1